MPLLHEGWDPEAPGSRFTERPGVALLAGEIDERRPIQEIADEFLGDLIERLADLGQPRVRTGALGRGGDATVPVVEWILGGIIGGTAFEGARLVSRKARELIDDLRRHDRSVSISRGMAALVALDAAAQALGDGGDFVVESVEEPATLRGERAHELNYVAIEPWICLVVERWEGKRAVVVVSYDGIAIGIVTQQLTEGERLYTYPPPRDM